MELVSRTPTCRQRRTYAREAPLQHLNLQEEAAQSENDAAVAVMTVIWAAGNYWTHFRPLFFAFKKHISTPSPHWSPPKYGWSGWHEKAGRRVSLFFKVRAVKNPFRADSQLQETGRQDEFHGRWWCLIDSDKSFICRGVRYDLEIKESCQLQNNVGCLLLSVQGDGPLYRHVALIWFSFITAAGGR